MSMQDKTGLVPIRKTFLRPNYRFALEFREGFVFGRVIKKRVCEYRPWNLIDPDGDAIDISPNSSYAAEIRFRDVRNTANDILYLKTTVGAGFPWFYHGSFGIWPPQVRMWLRLPESVEIPAKFPNVDPIRPQLNDNLGYIDHENSPYGVPTDHVTCVIPPLMHIGAEFYNQDDDDSHRPIVHILFSLYQCQIFKPDRHPDIISDIASGRKGADFLMVGFGDHANNIDEQLIADWRIDPVSLDEAQSLGEIRGPTPVREAAKEGRIIGGGRL